MKTRRIAALAASLTLLSGGAGYALTRDVPYTLETTQPRTELFPRDLEILPSPICHEDEPCWDCATMGDKVCGLPATEAPTYYHTDRAGAPRPLVKHSTPVVTLPDGNLTAIAQGPAVAPQEPTAPTAVPDPPAVMHVDTPSGPEYSAPVVWAWRTPTRENGWTQSGEGATGCWSAYDLRRKPMREHAPELNAFNWEVMRRNGAEPLSCSHPDVIGDFDPTVPLKEPSE